MNVAVESKYYRVYNKILFLQSIVGDIFELGEEYGVRLQSETKQLFGDFEIISLEEFDDTKQMEGYIRKWKCQIEHQYAYSITKLMECKPELKEALLSIFIKSGVNLAITLKEHYLTAPGIYKNLQDYMPTVNLDGSYNEIVMESDREVIWTVTASSTSCLEEIGGSDELYYELSEGWMGGFVRELGYQFDSLVAGTYRIYL